MNIQILTFESTLIILRKTLGKAVTSRSADSFQPQQCNQPASSNLLMSSPRKRPHNKLPLAGLKHWFWLSREKKLQTINQRHVPTLAAINMDNLTTLWLTHVLDYKVFFSSCLHYCCIQCDISFQNSSFSMKWRNGNYTQWGFSVLNRWKMICKPLK